ncbi:MAG: hypothetical protein AAFN18_13180 [Cyanobacteria bacterium J06554_6]
MSFSKSLLSSSALAGIVFATSLVPLALFGAKPLTVQVGQRPVFSGQLRDLSTPYLGLAVSASVGAGLVALAISGWRQSQRQVSQVERQLAELDQQVQEKSALIEDLAFSEAKLKALGLEVFLQSESGEGTPLTAAALLQSVEAASAQSPRQSEVLAVVQ